MSIKSCTFASDAPAIAQIVFNSFVLLDDPRKNFTNRRMAVSSAVKKIISFNAAVTTNAVRCAKQPNIQKYPNTLFNNVITPAL